MYSYPSTLKRFFVYIRLYRSATSAAERLKPHELFQKILSRRNHWRILISDANGMVLLMIIIP